MKISGNKPLIALCSAAAVFSILFLHDSNLYPHLSITHRLVLSLLRLTLLAVPVCAAMVLGATNKTMAKTLAAILLLMFIPYTLYCVTEIRHIAELCPTMPGADTCSVAGWKLLPPFMYALLGIAAYGFCLFRVHVRRVTGRIVLLVLYISLAAQFALQSRFNSWDIFTQPSNLAPEASKAASDYQFWVSSAAFFIFFISITVCFVLIRAQTGLMPGHKK